MDALRDTARPAVLDEGAVSTFKAALRGKLFRPETRATTRRARSGTG